MTLVRTTKLLVVDAPVRSLSRTLFANLPERGDGDPLRLHYELSGRGAHPVLLLPGALGSTQTDFGPQLQLMKDDKDLGLVAWDPRVRKGSDDAVFISILSEGIGGGDIEGVSIVLPFRVTVYLDRRTENFLWTSTPATRMMPQPS